MTNKVAKTLIFILFTYILISFVYDKYAKNRNNTTKINLENICPNTKSSLYVIIFKDKNITLFDKQNALEYMFINKDDLTNKFFVDCSSKQRLFNIKYGVILKTKTDSIDIESSYQKLHGYMGVFMRKDDYYVDSNGTIKPKKQIPNECR